LATKREFDFYTAEEFKTYIDIAKQQAEEKQAKKANFYEWNFYTFFNIAFYTGLRKGEMLALRWTDIQGEYVSIKRSVNAKGVETPPKNRSSIRTIQLPIPLIKILNEHKERQMQLPNFNEDSRILGDSKCLCSTTIRDRNILFSSLAGLKRIRIHDFRHSHASFLAFMGINIQEISRRLGHAKIEMTWNTYSHLYPKEEQRATAVLNAA